MPALKPAIARRKPDTKASPSDQFVERLAVAMEADGLPRIAGRIFGLLLLNEEPLSLVSDEMRAAVEDSDIELSGGRTTIVRTGRSGISLTMKHGMNSNGFTRSARKPAGTKTSGRK